MKIFFLSELICLMIYQVSSQKTKESIMNGSQRLVPQLYIRCLKNCQESSPKEETILEAGCAVQCEDMIDGYEWTYEPNPSSRLIAFENNKKRVRFKPDAFSVNVRAKFTIRLKKAQASFTLQFKRGPGLAIKCQQNCDNFNVSEPIILSASCGMNCDTDIESPYVWNSFPSSPNSESSGPNGEILTFPPNSMKGGQTIQVTVEKGSGKAQFFFSTQGDCDIYPHRGFSDTLFTLSCKFDNSTVVEVHEVTDILGDPKDMKDYILYTGPLANDKIKLLEGDPVKILIKIPTMKISNEVVVHVLPRDNKGEIIIKTLGEREDSLATLAKNRNYDAFIQQASIIITSLENNSDIEFKEHFFKHVVADMAIEAKHLNSHSVLNFLDNLKMDNYTDILTTSLVTECLEVASHKVQQECKNGSYPEILQYADMILNLTGKLIQASENASIEPLEEGGGDYPTYGDLAPVRTVQLQGMHKNMHSLLEIIRVVGRLHDKEEHHVDNMTALGLKTTTITLPWRNYTMIETTKGENTSAVRISNILGELISLEGGPQYCHVAVIKSNLFFWHEFGPKINTDLIMINIFTKRKNISQLSADIDIYLKRNNWTHGVIKSELEMGNEPWQVHKLEVMNNTMLSVAFKVIDNEYYALVTSYFPTLEEVRNRGRHITRGGKINRWTIEHKYIMVFVAVARKLGKPLKYEMDISEMGCAHWDGGTWEWKTDDCTLGPDTSDNVTHCRCRHLSLFAGTFFVPPNTIQTFSELPVEMKLRRTAIVLGVLAGVILIWTVVMVWAAGRDAVLHRRRVHRLPDTVPNDSHPYLVGVTTGLWQGAGTSAHVAIQLLGTKSNSRVHLMHGVGMLQQGAEDWFVLQTPKALGHVRAVRFYHDSYGSNPHWYCEHVEVRDFVKRRKYVFHASKWFSLIWGDGNVDRIFSNSEENLLRSNAVTFPHRVCMEMRDKHMWLGVFTRPLDSTFTTKERVVAASSVMMLSLLASAMFYGAGNGLSLDPQGSMNFTAREVRVILQTIFIVVPYGTVITILFRRSLPPAYA